MLSTGILTNVIGGLYAPVNTLPPTGADSAASGGVPSLFGPAAVLDLSAGAQRASANARLPRGARQRLENQRQRELLGGTAALAARQFDRAAKVADRLLRRDPNDADASHLMARIYDAQGKYGQAQRFYERAAELAPDNSDFASDAENARTLRGSAASVLATAERYLRNPDKRDQGLRLLSDYDLRHKNARSALQVGDVLMKFKSRKHALDFYNEALQRAPADDPVLSEVYDRALKLVADSPDAPVAHKFAGDAALKLKRYDDAISAYVMARATQKSGDPYKYDLAAAYNARGEHYRQSGKTLLAAGDFASAFYLDPGNPIISKNYNDTNDE